MKQTKNRKKLILIGIASPERIHYWIDGTRHEPILCPTCIVDMGGVKPDPMDLVRLRAL